MPPVSRRSLAHDGERDISAAAHIIESTSRAPAAAAAVSARGAKLTEDQAAAREALQSVDAAVDRHWRPRHRTVSLRVTSARQRLGGVRRWWRCPICLRRCRVLIAIRHEAPIGCRLCHHVRYVTDYPRRDCRRRFVALVHALDSGGLDTEHEREAD